MAKDKEKIDGKGSKGITTKKMVVIGGVFLIVTFVCTFTGVSLMMKKNNGQTTQKKVEEKQKPIETEHLPLGDDFVVNLSEVGAKRYVKANVTLAYNLEDKEFGKNIEKNVVILRDTTISYLKARSEEQLKDLEELKSGLVKELNKELKKENTITDAYFQSFLIQ
ncbi:MAG: flagellar basal body-associated FliL family protein [Sarcina sp.]